MTKEEETHLSCLHPILGTVLEKCVIQDSQGKIIGYRVITDEGSAPPREIDIPIDFPEGVNFFGSVLPGDRFMIPVREYLDKPEDPIAEDDNSHADIITFPMHRSNSIRYSRPTRTITAKE